MVKIVFLLENEQKIIEVKSLNECSLAMLQFTTLLTAASKDTVIAFMDEKSWQKMEGKNLVCPCKKCGRTELFFLPRETEDKHEKLVQEVMAEMESWDCDKLAHEMLTSPMAFRYFAAKRILIKRGHKDE